MAEVHHWFVQETAKIKKSKYKDVLEKEQEVTDGDNARRLRKLLQERYNK